MATESIETRYKMLIPHLDERGKRLWLGSEALSIGRGGITKVSVATGVSRNTIAQGCKEIHQAPLTQITGKKHRVRNEGGGRKSLVELNRKLLEELESLVEPSTRGDPECPLRWTTKSLRHLSDQLSNRGYIVSFRTIGTLLHNLGYSLQSNKKVHEGKSHADRDEQFLHINNQCQEFIMKSQPVISVDAKKKELIGNLKNNGREWQLKNKPEEVNVYDFPSLYSKVTPYGVYDIGNNLGWVNVGIDKDTASFAVESIRRWWIYMGYQLFPVATKLLITADCGGSNGYRVRLWKTELQKFANEEKLSIKVCHLPPGTSKWNKIEHRLFSFISMNWRGRPLKSIEIVINLISSITTQKGLIVGSSLDSNEYPRGIKISDSEMSMINIETDEFHGEWNYTIHPSQ